MCIRDRDKSCSPHRMRDEALEQLVLDTVKQYIRDVVDLDDILAMTDTAPLRAAEAQKVQRQLDKKRSEYERLQKLLHELVEKIVVHEGDKSSGHRIQKIDIYYSFVGDLETSHVVAQRTLKDRKAA